MAIGALQERLRKTLSRRYPAGELTPAICDRLWNYLIEGGSVRDAETDSPDGWRGLVADARQWMDEQPHGATSTISAELDVSSVLREHEVERAAMIANYAAQRAAQLPAVLRFREQVLGGQLLTPEEALALPSSATARQPYIGPPAQPDATRDYAQSNGHDWIPPGLTSTQWWSFGESLDDVNDDWGSPIGFHSAFRSRRPWDDDDEGFFHVDQEGALKLAFREPGTGPEAEQTVLSELWELGDLLNASFGWGNRPAAWFVLTGCAPPLQPVRAVWRSTTSPERDRHVVVLLVEPWVSSATVRDAYLYAQQRTFNRRNRPTSIRERTLFRFVTSAQADVAQDSTKRALLQRWNTTYPQWSYPPRRAGDEVRVFWRDYTRVKQRFLYPSAARSARPLRPPAVGPERVHLLLALDLWLKERGLWPCDNLDWASLLEEWNAQYPAWAFHSGSAEQRREMFRAHCSEAPGVARELHK